MSLFQTEESHLINCRIKVCRELTQVWWRSEQEALRDSKWLVRVSQVNLIPNPTELIVDVLSPWPGSGRACLMWSSRETFRFAHQAEHQLFFDVCQTLSESPRLTTGSVSLKPAPRMFAEVPADAWFEMFLLSTRSVDDESACLADCLLSVADWWVARCFSTYLDDLSRLVCRVCADLFKYYDYTAAGTPNTHFGIKCPDSPFLKTGIWSFHQPWSVIGWLFLSLFHFSATCCWKLLFGGSVCAFYSSSCFLDAVTGHVHVFLARLGLLCSVAD